MARAVRQRGHPPACSARRLRGSIFPRRPTRRSVCMPMIRGRSPIRPGTTRTRAVPSVTGSRVRAFLPPRSPWSLSRSRMTANRTVSPDQRRESMASISRRCSVSPRSARRRAPIATPGRSTATTRMPPPPGRSQARSPRRPPRSASPDTPAPTTASVTRQPGL